MTGSTRRPARPRPAADPAAAGFAAWLTGRSDAQLVTLLRRRPDLVTAPPKSTAVLAARALGRMSVHRAADELDTGALAALEALIVLDADTTPAAPAAVRELLSARGDGETIDAAVGRLRDLALAWGEDEITLATAAREILPWPVGHLTGDLAPADPAAEAELRTRIDDLDPDRTALLTTLARGSGLGRSADAAPGADPTRPIPRLIADGLLERVDERTVRLPTAVRAVLTGLPAPANLAAPETAETSAPIEQVDAAAAGAALEILRETVALLAELGAAPAAELRSGGIGVREVGRFARSLSHEPDHIALLLEVAAAAKLIGSGRPEPAPADDTGQTYQAPTAAADEWLDADDAERWAALARAWLAMRREPRLVGRRDEADRPIPALDPQTEPGRAAFDRRAVLAVLADLPAGTGIDAEGLLELLRWRRPRRHARLPLATVEATLTEAAALGLVAHSALSTPGRELLTEADPAPAMAAALPEPVDHVFVQADLTVVVPGPPARELQTRLDLLGRAESTGAALVYRIDEDAVRTAMDAGHSAEDLHMMLAEISRTPVPQTLTYLIDDVARRHGRLRVGYAGCFLRAEDEAALSEALAAVPELGLRRIAPTVAISPLDLALVLDRLAEAGVTAVGEDASGAVIDLSPPPARVPVPRRTRIAAARPDPGQAAGAELRAVVAGMRAADTLAAPAGATGPAPERAAGAAGMELIDRAIRLGRSVALEHVDAAGRVRHRIVDPLGIEAGVLTATDPVSDQTVEVALHRITTVALVD